jgi:acyl carrier protein
MSQHLETVQLLVAHQLGIKPENVGPDSDLCNDLNLDSLDHVELVMAIEDEYSIPIEDGECDHFRTPAHFAAYLDHRLGTPPTEL